MTTKRKPYQKQEAAELDAVLLIAMLQSSVAILKARVAELEKPPASTGNACGAGGQSRRPSFPVGTVVKDTSLIVDNCGVSWWVNPHAKDIEPA